MKPTPADWPFTCVVLAVTAVLAYLTIFRGVTWFAMALPVAAMFARSAPAPEQSQVIATLLALIGASPAVKAMSEPPPALETKKADDVD